MERRCEQSPPCVRRSGSSYLTIYCAVSPFCPCVAIATITTTRSSSFLPCFLPSVHNTNVAHPCIHHAYITTPTTTAVLSESIVGKVHPVFDCRITVSIEPKASCVGYGGAACGDHGRRRFGTKHNHCRVATDAVCREGFTQDGSERQESDGFVEVSATYNRDPVGCVPVKESGPSFASFAHFCPPPL